MYTDLPLAMGVRDLVLAAERYRIRLARDILDINGTELIALGIIRLDGPQTPSQLARALGITTPSGTELLDRLERSRLVQRAAHPTDRRMLLVSLTPRAEAGIDRVYRGLEHLLTQTVRLDEDAQRTVVQWLSDAAGAVRSATEDGVR